MTATSIERMALDLSHAVSTREREVERLREDVCRLRSELESAREIADDPDPEGLLPFDCDEAQHLVLVLRHLREHTGIYDLADLYEAAERCGFDL